MTLRRKLLVAYGIVILLSFATIGIALSELSRARHVALALKFWPEERANAARFMDNFPDEAVHDPEEYASQLASTYRRLTDASEYTLTDSARSAMNQLSLVYNAWQKMNPTARAESVGTVRTSLQRYLAVTEQEMEVARGDVEQQDIRMSVLPAIMIALTLTHMAVLGSLLRRWLLHPIERLTRQVEALGRDESPSEPLLESPPELGTLARALDQARRSLGAARQQLIESERLTAIGQFAAQIAHNLRNPLASIRAAAQVTTRVDSDRQALVTRMNDIIASVDRMSRWIAGIMEVARREATPTRDADILPTLERVAEALRPEATEKELTLDVQLPARPLVCTHDPATLEHALIAMVVNAIEASPLGSAVIVRVDCTAASNGQGLCRILVQDHGSGLPPDEPERIFEVSYSTKQRGMGLGLALARQALQRQGAAAHAYNNPDGGATVYVELPLSPPAPCGDVAGVPDSQPVEASCPRS